MGSRHGPGDRVRRRADARRLAIVRAAARVFRDRGFAAAGMRDIALAADLSAGNLYHYFAGKDELLFFCQDRTLDRLLAALASARASGAAAVPRLHALALAHVRCLIDEVDGSAAHIEVDALPPRLRHTIVAKRDRYERGVRAIVADGARRGELTAVDATIATRAFLGALNWTARWFRPEGPHDADLVSTSVATYAVAGLAGQGAPREPETRLDRADRQRRTGQRRVRPVQDAPRAAS